MDENYFEEELNSLGLIASIEDYYYEIGFNDGKLNTKLLDITNDDFFYYIDNGSISWGIQPSNISTDFQWWFRNEIEPKLEEELWDGIINNGWKQFDIVRCYESYIPYIYNWFKTKLLNLQGSINIRTETDIENDKGEIETQVNITPISMSNFLESLYIKIVY